MVMRGNVQRGKHAGAGRHPAARIKPLAACIRLLLAGGLLSVPLANAELPQALPGGRWQGALDPRLENGGLDMVIQQTARSATLDWRSFDIGAGNSVHFSQPGSDAVALNRIYDNDPSLINGKLSADGQVYLINRNGILFGQNAQINVNSLVASTLNIEERLFEEGILGAIQDGQPVFVADPDMPEDATIEILTGAQLDAGQGDGGRILILAPHVINRGTINTPDGQAVLAASKDSVYLAQSGDPNLRGLLVEVNTGGDVENVGSIIAERGNASLLGLSVNQNGLVRATSTVSLNGSIRLVAGDNSTTSNAPGIRRSQDVKGTFFNASGGALELGQDSVTEVLPAGGGQAVDSNEQPTPYIDMAGREIVIKSGARVTATGGDVLMRADSRPNVTPFTNLNGVAEEGVGVRIESGALIDVSGDDTTRVSVSRNVIEVEARGNQLADSPLQRDGAIRNRKLYVDVRKDTPFLNADLEISGIQRGVNERLSTGGTVTVQSTGDVIVDAGAGIDISGGRVAYSTGTVSTSKLVGSDGKVYDISRADPDRTYVNVLNGVNSVEQGYTEGKDAGKLVIQSRRQLFNGNLLAGSHAGLLQRGLPDPSFYLSGFVRPFDQRPHGGSLVIDLSSTTDGQELVIGNDGRLQRVPAPGESLADGAPTVLSADMLQASGLSEVDITTNGSMMLDAPLQLPGNGRFNLQGGRIEVNDDIRIAGGAITMNAERNDRTGVNGNGIAIDDSLVGITVASGVELDVSGRWTNDAPRFNPDGARAPILSDGGSISLQSGGLLQVAQGAALDVSGGGHLDQHGKLTSGRGGTIALGSSDNTDFDSTEFSVAAELRGFAFEQGGALELLANQFLVADQVRVDTLLQERLPDGSPRYRLTGSGSLRSLLDSADGSRQVLVDPQRFQSGGFSKFRLNATRRGLGVAEATRIDLRALNYLADSRALSGFITGNRLSASGSAGGSAVGSALEMVPGGTDLTAFTRVEQLPDYLRRAVDLSLVSQSRLPTDIDPSVAGVPLLSVGEQAAILADPGASVALESDTLLYVDGRISAPAGAISLTLDSAFDGYAPQQAIRLGEYAELDAGGAVLLMPNSLGRRQGEVLDAGTVDLRANLGSIITEEGSRIAVDAVAETLDLTFGGALVATGNAAARAGAISLTAAESMLLQGDLSARAATDASIGGGLSLKLDPGKRAAEVVEIDPGTFVPESRRYPNAPRVINLAGFADALPERGDALPAEINGQAFLAPETVAAGGFDSLSLTALTAGDSTTVDAQLSNAAIRFPQDLDLSLNHTLILDAPVLSTTDAAVNLGAAYVAIGSTDTRFRLDGAPVAGGGAYNLDPAGGDGTLRVDADLIDLVGDSVLQGFGSATSPAATLVSHGDIRLRGTRLTVGRHTEWEGSLRVAGDLLLQAQQLYPTTLSDFALRVEATESAGRLEVLGQNGAPGQPLSAGGRVTLHADDILLRDGARVRAPIGRIALTGDAVNAAGDAIGARSITLKDGSLLSTSAEGLSIPFGYTQFQNDLVLPISGVGTLQFVVSPEGAVEKALPQKLISLAADAIDVQSGAQFDLSGGGDIRATEFVPGPGGSTDILQADLDSGDGVRANSSFAILPLLGSEFAPFDPVESPAAESLQGIRTGQTLVLQEGIAGLPAGEYAILPARYALFGGYLVTPVEDSANLPVSQNSRRTDGVAVLAGHYGLAGTDIADTRSQGFAIEDGTGVRLRAEYAESSLDQLFGDDAVRTPVDAGNLTLQAGKALHLAGNLVAGITGGRGSEVDIVANEIAILNQPNGGTGVELLADDLAGLNADSLLIGATRTLTADGLQVTPAATRIDVGAGVDLEMQELIMVADRLNIGAGDQATRLTAKGTDSREADMLVVNGDAAVAMVSVRRGAEIARVSGNGESALNLAAAATLSAPGSIVADAGGNVDLAGTLDTGDGSLVLGGASVNLGETDGLDLSGLNLSNADLSNLAGSDLSLRSSGVVNIYGTLQDAAGNAHRFQRLAIDSRGIAGRDSSVARMAADDLSLRNSSGDAVVNAAAGTGVLQLQGERIRLEGGSFAVSGYAQSNLNAAQYLLADGSGELTLEGAGLNLVAPLITAASGAEYSVIADGAMRVSGADTTTALPDAAGLGAVLNLEAAGIDYSGNVVLPSGRFAAKSAGDFMLNSSAVIDVAGRDLSFDTRVVGTSGGDILLQSRDGDIIVNAGVTLDASGAPAGGSAGRLEFESPRGTLLLSPEATLRAADSGADRGEILINTNVLASTAATADNLLSALNQQLEAGGFRGRRDLRLRSGDLELAAGQTMRAREVKLTADAGRIVIDGGIDASGSDGGTILLAAGDALDVNGRLDAHATAAQGDGGRIELSARDADGDSGGSLTDVVNLDAGAVLDVRGGEHGAGGSVLVRGAAYDANGDGSADAVAIGSLDATVQGAARMDVEAVHAFTDADGVITDLERDTWRNMLDQFMAVPQVNLPTSWRLVPGLEIGSAGDLTLQTVWDLYAGLDDADPANDWRFGAGNDIAGILTLRAGRDVILDASLTDGFKADEFFLAGTPVAYERLGIGEAWRYRLVAGADRSSADVTAKTGEDAPGDIRLAAGQKLRTGTGDIELVATGNLDIGQGAAVYTAGLNTGFGALADLDINLSGLANILFFPEFEIRPAIGEEFLLAYLNKGQFGAHGGDVRIDAGGSLLGQATQPRVTDWQPRLGGDFDNGKGIHFESLPTYWAIAYENFSNGIGALGGGDVTARVGGDVRDLAIALPATGKAETFELLVNDESALIFAADQNTPQVSGGGDLDLVTGGDFQGGVLQVDRGDARVRVGGSFGTQSGTTQPYIAIADTRVVVEARAGVGLAGVLNATALEQTANLDTVSAIDNLTGVYDPLFFSYGSGSTVELTAVADDVTLHGTDAAIRGHGFDLYPANLKVHGLQGGIGFGGTVQTFPSAAGQLELLAEEDIRHVTANGLDYLIQSDADLNQLPSMTRVAVYTGSSDDQINTIRDQFLSPPNPNQTSGVTTTGRNFHAVNPVHTGDSQSNLIVSRSGSILGRTDPLDLWQLIFAKQTRISAGQDIRNMSVSIQHIEDTDISLVSAGGSIVQDLSRNASSGDLSAARKILEIAGPGRLDVLAAADVDLGTSLGIVSIGDTANPALADEGAAIVVIAGLAEAPDYAAFIKSYLEESSLYLNDLNAHLAGRGIDVTGDPVGVFSALPELEQRELILDILFAELKEGGNAGVTSGNYTRGFTAIATLFPSQSGAGDIATPVSVIKSVDNGNIDLLAPRGDINAGATFRAIEKGSDELGVITGRGGDISIYLDGDLEVNRERVIALQGDLLAWSSNGSIDAGKGAKSIVSIPDPIVTFDANGNVIVVFPPAVEGSGLSAVNAFLFAPRGAINAGDAGIRASGNLTIGAVEVIGADNIDVGGVSVGVPTDSTGVDIPVVDTSALTSTATSMADTSTSSFGDDPDVNSELGIMSVQVMGFGDCPADDSGCGK